MGTAKMSVRDFPGALKDFARAAELNPALPSVHSYYGQALLATGDSANAAKEFREELAHDPNDFESNLNLGALLRQDEKYDESARYIERALRVRPADPQAEFQMASLELAGQQLQKSRERLEAIVKSAPTFLEAHVLLATIYYRLKLRTDGDRERALIAKLNAQIQANQPAARSAAPVKPQ
jgi:tetratricopeptide (TPR) repeat protein